MDAMINWIEPTKRKRGLRVSEPQLRVLYRPGKKIEGKKSISPSYRIIANEAFFKKFYSGKGPHRISISIGGNGILFITDPGKKIPHFVWNKGKTINDQGLVERIFKEVGEVFNQGEGNTVKFSVHPKGTLDSHTLYKLEKLD